MTDKQPSPPINFIDDPHAPDVFSDGCTGIFVQNGIVKLTFESARVNHESTPGPINRVVIGRLVMSIAATESLKNLLVDWFDKSKPISDPFSGQSAPTIQ